MYKIKTSVGNLNKISQNCTVKEIVYLDNGEVTCSVSSLDNDIQYELITSTKEIYQKKIKANMFFLFGLLFFVCYVLIYQKSISSIAFIQKSKIQTEVEQIIDSNMKKIAHLKFLTVPIDELNQKIKAKYFNYEWINVTKKGTTLFVEIKEPLDNSKVSFDNQEGNIIAKCDAIISYFFVSKGFLSTDINHYVKKGDVLVNEYIDEQYVGASGIILGEFFETIDIVIPKTEVITELTGRTKLKKVITLFGKNIVVSKKNSFADYIEKTIYENTVFSFFTIKNLVTYEKNDIINTYNEEEAEKAAIQYLYSSFEYDRVSEYEKIKEVFLLGKKTEENEFLFTFLVKKIESIGIKE